MGEEGGAGLGGELAFGEYGRSGGHGGQFAANWRRLYISKMDRHTPWDVLSYAESSPHFHDYGGSPWVNKRVIYGI
jgi:hypothetical protein